LLHRGCERRPRVVAEGLLEPAGRDADAVEVVGGGEPRLGLERLREPGGGVLGVLDSLWRLGLADLGQARAELGQVTAAGRLLGDLAERRDRYGLPDGSSA